MTNFYYCSFVKYYIKVSLNTGSELGWLWRLVQNSYQGISVYLFSTVIRVNPDTGSKQLSRWFWILVQFCYQGVSGEWFGTVFFGYWSGTVIRVNLGTGSERLSGCIWGLVQNGMLLEKSFSKIGGSGTKPTRRR